MFLPPGGQKYISYHPSDNGEWGLDISQLSQATVYFLFLQNSQSTSIQLDYYCLLTDNCLSARFVFTVILCSSAEESLTKISIQANDDSTIIMHRAVRHTIKSFVFFRTCIHRLRASQKSTMLALNSFYLNISGSYWRFLYDSSAARLARM